MPICTDPDCPNTELISYDDTKPIVDLNSPTNFRRTKKAYLWASTENSTIQMTTKIGNKSLTSIQVYLKRGQNGEYHIIVSDSCEIIYSIYQKYPYHTSCKVDDLYIRFGDQGSRDPNHFPSIRISYDGKFFYSQS